MDEDEASLYTYLMQQATGPRRGAGADPNPAPSGADAAAKKPGEQRKRLGPERRPPGQTGRQAGIETWLKPHQDGGHRKASCPSVAAAGGLSQPVTIGSHNPHHISEREGEQLQHGSGPSGGGRKVERTAQDGPGEDQPHLRHTLMIFL